MSEQMNLSAVLAIGHSTTLRDGSRSRPKLFSCPGSLLILSAKPLVSTYRLIRVSYQTLALWQFVSNYQTAKCKLLNNICYFTDSD